MKRKILIFVLMMAMVLNLSACGKAPEEKRYEASFLELFDTVTKIVGYGSSKEDFTAFSQKAYDDLKVYHELYDIYNDYDGINNVKTINDNAGKEPVKVDQKIIDLLKFGKQAYELSGGKLNIAYGAVLSVWHTYREDGINDPENAKLPPMDVLKEKAKHTDINNMIIDEKNSTVFLKDPEMSLDVGAIAKGYATEMVARDLEKNGCRSAMLSVGGNVRSIGAKLDGTPWNVGIQNPDLESDQTNLYVLALKGYSLVTSGDYQRYYTVDGKRYHHIIDPDTLMPAQYFTAVSIVTKDSGMGDALSTTVYNMPYEQGLKLIESLPDTEALWVFKNGDEKYSPGFSKLIKK